MRVPSQQLPELGIGRNVNPMKLECCPERFTDGEVSN